MKQHQLNALLVGVVALALGACSSTGKDMSSQTSSTTTTTTTDTQTAPAVSQQSDASPSSPASPASSSSTQSPSSATASTSTPDQTGYTPSPAMANANSIVTLIEVVPRQSANQSGSDTSGSSTSGSSGTSGSTAAGASDKVYRVTLHMDDGSTRVITQEVMPAFRAGDRVRLENGMIMR